MMFGNALVFFQACIIPPAQRSYEIDLCTKALGLFDSDNPWISGTDMQVLSQPLSVVGRILPPPAIIYGSESVEIDPVRVSFKY